jgi:hypothetical protein
VLACHQQCLRPGKQSDLTKSERCALTLAVHHRNRIPEDNRERKLNRSVYRVSPFNSTRLSPAPLVFKTVHETLISQGSSMIWCLLRIPHYPFILDSFKCFGGFRLDTVAVGFAARTAIIGCLYIMAMSM